MPQLTGICASATRTSTRPAAHLDAVLDGLGVPRELTDKIVGIVAGLRPHIVTA